MIYSHSPQRAGRSIPTNTNTSPQDPPSPPEIPDVFIEDSTPPVMDTVPVTVPEISKPVKKVTPKISKPVIETPVDTVPEKPKSWFRRTLSKIIFWRRN